MTTNQNSSSDPDSWEGLARDLFGIDVGKNDGDDEPFEVIDLSSLEPAAEAEPVTSAESAFESEEVDDEDDQDIVFEDDDDDDFDIIFEEEDEEDEAVAIPSPARKPAPEPKPVAEDRKERAPRQRTPKSDAADSFWEPLDDWDVTGRKSSARGAAETTSRSRAAAADEGDSVEEVAQVAKKERAEVSRKHSPPAQRQKPPVSEADDSFGFGVLDDDDENFFEHDAYEGDEVAVEISNEQPAVESRSSKSDDDDSEEKPRRRRRRRRRGRRPTDDDDRGV